ncbi:MAG: ribosome silencing factor [Hyphomicrobiaceae bacterium]
MPIALEGAVSRAPHSESVSEGQDSEALVQQILAWLDDAKAEDVISINLDGKSSVADFMVIASGRSDRHVGAVADQIRRKLKEHGQGNIRTEGAETCDWVLLDTGDIIIHVFRPEVREFYNLEKMWLTERPAEDNTAH